MTAASAAARGVTALLLLLGLLVPILGARTPALPCDPANPSARNCVASCQPPCKSSKCLYKCHYDTTLAILSLAVTSPGGASVAAFTSAVANLSLYLADDVFVRINPLGMYRGKAEVADYVATFQHPLGLGSRVSVKAIDITHHVNTGQVSATTVNLAYAINADPTHRITNLTVVLFNRFDPVTQKLQEGDWNFLRFPEFQVELNKPDPRVSDEVSAKIIQAVCGVDAQVCKPLGYPGYDNVTDCQAFISSIPRIAMYGLQGNNQYCRFLHVAYATVDPKMHCPHISRSGGNVCVDQVYNDYYTVFPTNPFFGIPVA